ncbi:hypothetical protein PIROE2DRAFT_17901 [Piromyces sp. E2]|nr:hypothetical protein PIROE2DRAFT_17901 [Piromyces sp. E2]|eukprot:OUM57181.1 hypothetical protein PIROE2DRAFT_17901 [Piromyces sp. E2]
MLYREIELVNMYLLDVLNTNINNNNSNNIETVLPLIKYSIEYNIEIELGPYRSISSSTTIEI